MSLPLYRVIKNQTHTFAATAFYRPDDCGVHVRGRARHVDCILSSASLFRVLGIQPLLGRTFTAENLHTGSDDVAVISFGLWRESFGADPDVIGKTVRFDGGVRRIIGVMPKGFAFPDRTAELWVPNTVTPEEFSPKLAFSMNVYFIGRLKPRVSLNAAKVQVQHAVRIYVHDAVPANLQKMARGSEFAMDIQSWRDHLLGDRPATLWLLQGAVLLILLMTCVNVANLLLSRILVLLQGDIAMFRTPVRFKHKARERRHSKTFWQGSATR